MVLLILLLSPHIAGAEQIAIGLKSNSGEELNLQDGRKVKLAGIHAPGDNARVALEKLTMGKSVSLEDAETDRYGRVAAQIYIGEGEHRVWVQSELLQAGVAFVYPPNGDESELDAMMKIEREARAAKRGFWGTNLWADTSADDAEKKYGQYAFIAGKVLKVERIKNMVYLNFGADWHTDFTITIAAHDLHNFKNGNIDPADYEGKIVRVRGWVKREFGPMIDVTHPAQIEMIGTP